MSDRTMVILLVEDQPTDVLLVKRAFSRVNPGATLHSVADGDAAVAYLSGDGDFGDRKRHPLPDLLLLDLKLPRRSGLEVLAWLRAQVGLHRLPAIMLTSSGEQRDINQAYDLRVNSFLSKPTAFEDLHAMVQAIDDYCGRWNAKPVLEGAE